MDIGTEQPAITIEPIQNPVPGQDNPAPPEPDEPVEVPDETPVEVPA